MEQIRFDDRVAVVTGAGNGLGRDYALELARRGARVVVNDLGGSGSGVGASSSAADQVVEEIRDAGGQAVANHDSVATRAGGAAIVQTALDSWGRLDICINNAGFLRDSRFEDLTDEQIDPIIDVHLKGAFYVSQPAYRAMRKAGYGRFLFTGSASSMFGHAWQANYAAGKGGLMGLSHVVAIEGAGYGIKSNLILPNGLTRLAQEASQGFMEIPTFAKEVQAVDFDLFKDRIQAVLNMPLAIYLVSEQCQETHSIFSCCGGRYAQVRIVAGEGWLLPSPVVTPSVEDIANHISEITDKTKGYEPLSNYQEYAMVEASASRKGIAL